MLVTFDFSGTIADVKYNGAIVPKKETINVIMEHHKKGDDMAIVSSAFGDERQEILDFLSKNEIPIDDVFTVGSDKIETIVDLEPHIHYDDSDIILEVLEERIPVKGVLVK